MTTTDHSTPRTFHDLATWRRLGSESETEDRDGGFAARGSDLSRDEIAADCATYHAADLARCADDAARAEAIDALVEGYLHGG